MKVLDFGLAKAFAPAGSKDPAYENLTQSPTITTPAPFAKATARQALKPG